MKKMNFAFSREVNRQGQSKQTIAISSVATVDFELDGCIEDYLKRFDFYV